MRKTQTQMNVRLQHVISEERLVFKKVQVPPSDFVRVIGLAENPANGTGKDTTAGEIQMDVEPTGRLVESATARESAVPTLPETDHSLSSASLLLCAPS